MRTNEGKKREDTRPFGQSGKGEGEKENSGFGSRGEQEKIGERGIFTLEKTHHKGEYRRNDVHKKGERKKLKSRTP